MTHYRHYFLTLLMLLFAAGASAQQGRPDDNPAHTAAEAPEDNPPLRLGYCNTPFNPYYTRHIYEQTDKAHEFGAAIYLPPETVAKYVGATISSIHFALYEEVGTHYTAFIAQDLVHPLVPLVTQTVTRGNFQQGWNAVNIPPYTITGREGGLYIGWLGAVEQREAMKGYFTLDHNKNQFEHGLNWIMDAEHRWFKVQEQVGLNLMIRAYGDGPNLPSHDIGILTLDGPDVLWQNSPTTFDFTLVNYGQENIMNADIELLADGEVYDHKRFNAIDLDHNERITLPLSGVSYPTEGNHTLAFRITKINGVDDSDPSDNERELDLYAVAEDAQPYPRNTLFEEMTSERDPVAPKADFIFNAAIEQRREMMGYSDVIWVKHHIDGVGKRKNGQPWDTYAQNEDREYVRFYEGYPNGAYFDFTPAVTVDRNIIKGMEEAEGIAYFVTDELALGGLFALCQTIPAYIEVKPTIAYDEATQSLSIDVDAESCVSEMIHQTDLRLTVYVVEDHLPTVLQLADDESAQYLNADGSFTQNGVIRAYPAGVWGESVDISGYAFHRHYDVPVPEDWTPQNLRVVAFVHNYELDALHDNNVVYNAGQAYIAAPAGISSVVNDGVKAPAACYDLQGRRVTKPEHGVYIQDGRRIVR